MEPREPTATRSLRRNNGRPRSHSAVACVRATRGHARAARALCCRNPAPGGSLLRVVAVSPAGADRSHRAACLRRVVTARNSGQYRVRQARFTPSPLGGRGPDHNRGTRRRSRLIPAVATTALRLRASRGDPDRRLPASTRRRNSLDQHGSPRAGLRRTPGSRQLEHECPRDRGDGRRHRAYGAMVPPARSWRPHRCRGRDSCQHRRGLRRRGRRFVRRHPPLTDTVVPVERTPAAIPAAAVIALLGFAEASSIARTYAAVDRSRWDPNREFVSQGVANVAASITNGMPVGASFRGALSIGWPGREQRSAGSSQGSRFLRCYRLVSCLRSFP